MPILKARLFFKKHRLVISWFILIALLGAIAITAYLYFQPRSSLPNRVKLKPSPRLSESALVSLPPLPHGKFDFSVSQADKTKPQFSQGVLDPYDPLPNAAQTITINVSDLEPVTRVAAQVRTDHQLAGPFPFQLKSGTAVAGTWQGSWVISDTYLQTFHIILTAESRRGQSTVDITLR